MKKFALYLLWCVALFAPQITFACAVCFGGEDDQLRQGFFWGIVLLGALPFVLIGLFIYTIRTALKKKQESLSDAGASHG